MAYSNKSRHMTIEERHPPKGLLSGPWLPHYGGGCDQGDQRNVGWGSGTGWSDPSRLEGYLA